MLAVWLVFQHNPLEQQKEFLPQLEEAVRNGDIAPMYLAMLKDRINVREGRPQKYGTQSGPDGLCPLQEVCKDGMTKDCGLLVNSSRGIIYASNGEDFAEVAGEKAKELQQEMAAELAKI